MLELLQHRLTGITSGSPELADDQGYEHDQEEAPGEDLGDKEVSPHHLWGYPGGTFSNNSPLAKSS